MKKLKINLLFQAFPQSPRGSEITRVHPGDAQDPQVPGYSVGALQVGGQKPQKNYFGTKYNVF